MNYVRLLPTPNRGLALLIRAEAEPTARWFQISHHDDVIGAKELARQFEHEHKLRKALLDLYQKTPSIFSPDNQPIAWPGSNSAPTGSQTALTSVLKPVTRQTATHLAPKPINPYSSP